MCYPNGIFIGGMESKNYVLSVCLYTRYLVYDTLSMSTLHTLHIRAPRFKGSSYVTCIDLVSMMLQIVFILLRTLTFYHFFHLKTKSSLPIVSCL